MEFAGALRQAIKASGLTLERIRHRLGRRGLAVSVATLSYWQRGRSRPRSRTVVLALEEILQVPPGALAELLDDPAPPGAAVRGAGARAGRTAGRPGAEARDLWPDPERHAWLVGQLDRSGDHRLERLGIHDVYRLDEARRSWTLSVRTVLRAADDDIDRVVCVHHVGDGDPAGGGTGDGPAALADVRYGRPGRIRAEGGLMAFELVFDRVLSAGDTAVVEYELGTAGRPPSDSYERRFPHPVHDYVAIIQFAGDRLPARCYGFTAESSAAARQRLGELWIGTSGSANLAAGAVRRGIVGIEWEWH
ncbi:helix-turn-helix domain-containing protein [Spirillospora sp. CA-128828]|uniref:helix-turn-helix domain-containing protein n=1 Tax=Spirillospora sp. CA-128828 TaxID=3240033 RepID=UPI003D9302C3